MCEAKACGRCLCTHRVNDGLGVRYRSAAAGCLLFSSALVEPVAVAVHFQNMDMVGQAIEQRAGRALGTEYFRPFVERQVRGDDD